MGKTTIWLFLAVLLAPMASAYSTSSFSIKLEVNEEGKVHAIERVVFLVESEGERNEVTGALNFVNPQLLTFKKFSKYVNYHLNGQISNVKIIARLESFDAASIEWEYDLMHPIFNITPKGSRLSHYTLNKGIFSFDSTNGTRLNEITSLLMELPKDAVLINKKINPRPREIENNALYWIGPFVSKEWEVEFEREKPLTQEVSEFFTQLYQNLFYYGPLAIVILLTIFVIIWFEKFLKAQTSKKVREEGEETKQKKRRFK